MRQQIDQYLRRLTSDNHPENDGLITRFSFCSFNSLNADQLIFFRYIKKDLIFNSGLFFVLFGKLLGDFITQIKSNQIKWALVRSK